MLADCQFTWVIVPCNFLFSALAFIRRFSFLLGLSHISYSICHVCPSHTGGAGGQRAGGQGGVPAGCGGLPLPLRGPALLRGTSSACCVCAVCYCIALLRCIVVICSAREERKKSCWLTYLYANYVICDAHACLN